MDDPVDILVVGAGISGLAFASTYLGAHPAANVLVIEREDMVGGTWNSRRLYDHFYSQGSYGYLEFADYPMESPQDQYCGMFNAKYTSRYLEEYAEHKTFTGQSLKDRIRFSTLLLSARKPGVTWELETQNAHTTQLQTIFARRLVLASGLTSIPKVPQLKGYEAFTGRYIHHIDFGSSGVLADPNIKHITVLGGGKSGADMLYAAVKAGKEAAWIVRPSTTGPGTYVDGNGMAGYKNASELASTRVVEYLQPSHFATQNWWTDFWNRSRLGLFLANKVWASAHSQIIASADYANRPSRGDFNKLEPHTPIFWRNNAAGILNHPDFYEVIANSVESYYDEVEELRGNEIRLESGRTIYTDALLLATGWQHSVGYLSPSLRAQLGLPYPLTAESEFSPSQLDTSKDWTRREQKADADVVAQYPILADPPPHFRSPMPDTPYRLYNLVVPVDDPTRSFAVIGMHSTTNYFRTGEAQSRWVTAYFDWAISLPAKEERKDEVAHVVAWTKRRYLSTGNYGNVLDFDTIRYTDRLFSELGLTSHLKTGWAYIFSPSRAKDYRGLGKEFTDRYADAESKSQYHGEQQ